MNSKLAIGIDLGTTNSVVAYRDETGVVQLVKNRDGSVITPSAVHFDRGNIEFGQAAVEAFAIEPNNTAMFFKRNMGNPNFAPEYGGKSRSSEDLSALFLGHLKQITEAQISDAGPLIVTVPAYFHNEEREATVRAARTAGFDVLRTINEPTAAAIAYGSSRADLNGLILVYDLGGGTFDVTLIEYTPNQSRVIASDGDNQLGGVQWDDRLMNYVSDRFQEEFSIDPLEDPTAFGDLRLRCEAAKKALSSRSEVRIAVNATGARGHVLVTRGQFEEITADLMDRTRTLMVRMMNSAGVSWPSIAGALLVGGSTRMPAVKQLLTQLARKEPLIDINPDECVAYGAAIEASTEAGGQILLSLPPLRKTSDVTPHSLGYLAISPDGSRYINDFIIKKNKPIPLTEFQRSILPTRPGNDNGLDIYLLQGESSRVLDNSVLGLYQVNQIPHKSGNASLEVFFQYDVSEIVQVRCRESVLGVDLPVVRVDGEPDLSWTDSDPRERAKEV